MTPYMQANSTYKEERQKILQSRKKRGKNEQKAKLTAEGRTILFPHSQLNRDDNPTGHSNTGERHRSLFVGPSKYSR
jgi:molybdenum-dependent DNA-binding transcriptional regulator ModE